MLYLTFVQTKSKNAHTTMLALDNTSKQACHTTKGMQM